MRKKDSCSNTIYRVLVLSCQFQAEHFEQYSVTLLSVIWISRKIAFPTVFLRTNTFNTFGELSYTGDIRQTFENPEVDPVSFEAHAKSLEKWKLSLQQTDYSDQLLGGTYQENR